jgi:hypothetical protein
MEKSSSLRFIVLLVVALVVGVTLALGPTVYMALTRSGAGY